ncbi:Myeloid leukemia factor [Diplonema papillatum]|nr:Myeloid leukemia factor [Diplonema papillatum]|eukprot:gene15075-23021_t
MEELLRRAEQGGTYHKKSSRVFNPRQGISESRMTVQDTAAHRETVELRRELGDQRVGMVKHYDTRTGVEKTHRDLHNVSSTEVESFDQRWNEASARSMPSYHTALAGTAGQPSRSIGYH